MTPSIDELKYLREHVMLSDLNSEILFLEKFLKKYGFTEELEDIVYEHGASPYVIRTLLLIDSVRGWSKEKDKVVRVIEEIAPVSLPLTIMVRKDPWSYIYMIALIPDLPHTCFNARITRKNTTVTQLMSHLPICCVKSTDSYFLDAIKLVLSEDDPVRKLAQTIHDRVMLKIESKEDTLIHSTVLSAVEATGFMEEYCDSIRLFYDLEVPNINRLVASIK